MIAGGILIGGEPESRDFFFPDSAIPRSCHAGFETLPPVGEGSYMSEVRAKTCALYLDSVDKGKTHRVEARHSGGSGPDGYVIFKVVEGGFSRVQFDSLYRDNEEMAKKVAEELTKRTGKQFIAVLSQKNILSRNYWTVVSSEK